MSSPQPQPQTQDPPREPMFKIPWPALVLIVGMIGAYAMQSRVPDESDLIYRYALIPAALTPDSVSSLMTSLFLHGSWAHVLMNAGLGLAFAAAVSRHFGTSLKGVLGFFIFYLACGVVSGLGFALIHTGSGVPVIGASGAVSGLMGAGIRLMGLQAYGSRALAPLNNRQVMGLTLGYTVINLVIAVLAFIPFLGGVSIAWEAHLIGYAFGLLTFPLWSQAFSR
ncbi:MAG: rhomboid family intramembrane serine protease [Asticcacaulis sp.]